MLLKMFGHAQWRDRNNSVTLALTGLLIGEAFYPFAEFYSRLIACQWAPLRLRLELRTGGAGYTARRQVELDVPADQTAAVEAALEQLHALYMRDQP